MIYLIFCMISHFLLFITFGMTKRVDIGQHTTPRVTTPSPRPPVTAPTPVTASPSFRPRTSQPHHVFYTGSAPHPSQCKLHLENVILFL